MWYLFIHGINYPDGPSDEGELYIWVCGIVAMILFLDIVVGIHIIPHGGVSAYAWLGLNVLAVSYVAGNSIANIIEDKRKLDDKAAAKVVMISFVSALVVAGLVTWGVGKLIIPPEKVIRKDNNKEQRVVAKQKKFAYAPNTVQILDIKQCRDGNYAVSYQDDKAFGYTIIPNNTVKHAKDNVAVMYDGKYPQILSKNIQNQRQG